MMTDLLLSALYWYGVAAGTATVLLLVFGWMNARSRRTRHQWQRPLVMQTPRENIKLQKVL